LKGFEFIKAVHLDPVPFDMERDLITPTYKKKRPQLLKYYQVKVVKFSRFHFCVKNYICFIIIGMDRMSCFVYRTFFFLPGYFVPLSIYTGVEISSD